MATTLTAAYGLVSPNAKWQIICDQLLIDMGIYSLSMLPQLFTMTASSKLVALIAKIVDDILICRLSSIVDTVFEKITQHVIL